MKKNNKRDQKIIDEFKDKKSRYNDHWPPIYEECQKHLSFTLEGNQLTDEQWSRMGVTNPMKPNLLITYLNHEANKTLQTDYRIKVTPNGSGASMVAARERQEVLRGLQRKTNIEQIFNKVRRQQAAGGIAYSIAKLDYAGKRGFGKTLDDEYLEDWKNVLPDINVKTPTFSDARDFLIRKMVPKSEWKSETGKDPDDWGLKKEKELWYYWVREDIRDSELLLEDGKTILESKLPELDGKPDYTGVKKGQDEDYLSRPTEDYEWCWYKITEDDVIVDEDTWKGSYCPLVACTGRKVIDSQGKVHYQPLTQFAEEPQIIYTILENIICLRLSRSPFSKYLVAMESVDVKDMEKLRQAAMLGLNDILYKAFNDSGEAIPPPEEIQPHVLDPILIELQREQEMKIQKIFGIYDANLGNKSNEQSGVAIAERAKGGELSNFDLQFLYMEYVQQVGRVKLDLIPKYLTAPQQMAFVDEDDNAVVQWINTTGGIQFSPDEEYSLSVEAMPISPTAREEESARLVDMAKVIPSLAQNPQAAALIIKSMPGRYTGQIADLLIQGDPRIQELQGQIQQLQGVAQQAQSKLQQTQAKQAQDQIAMSGMKNTVLMMKQMMGLMKEKANLESLGAEVQNQFDTAQSDIENTLKLLDQQTKQYTAESGRITAEAAMLKVVGDLAKPEPATPALGQPLP
jgi:hypothetical protein